ncbi:MAG TPA: glycosyltransferase family 4 protein [Vicinamibacterales bacterium]|jgi:sugar transferase (PEP-CTERM/EpsH1 system associated)
MQILWLKSDLLVPLDKGGRLRTWHLLRHLAERHAITYLAFAERDQTSAACAAMREVAAEVITVPREDPPKGSWRFYADAARHVIDPLPYAVGKYRSADYAARLRELLETHAFDLVVCDFLPPVVNLPAALPCPGVLFTHNVESEIWRRHAETRAGQLSGALYRQQYRRMLAFERQALARFDGALAVSDADRETFGRLYPGAARGPIDVIPTGVDTGFFTPSSATSASSDHSIVFTGSMDWLPNEDAMQFFCADVLRRIQSAVPDAVLSIVGRAPTPAVQRLAQMHGVRVTGRVDDVRQYLHDAAVFVVPLRIGGGTRLKIFEAMAAGKAVVSTTVGAEGLDVTPDEHLLIADAAPAFADAVVQLLRNSDRRRLLGEAARALVLAKYDWAAVAGRLEDALVRVARSTTTTTKSAA